MSYFYRILIKPIFIISLLCSLSSSITIESLSHAIDIAREQRMLTQKMLKDYSMIGMENSFRNPSKNLKKTVSTFQDHLNALYLYADSIDAKRKIEEIKEVWIPTEKILRQNPDRGDVVILQENLDRLLGLSNDIARLFIKESGKPIDEMLSILGKEKILSQRMASLYLLKVWGVDNIDFKNKMDSVMLLFKNSLNLLKKSNLNDNKSDKLLTDTEKSFIFFEVMSGSDNIFIPALIYKKSDDILENMDRLGGYYMNKRKEIN